MKTFKAADVTRNSGDVFAAAAAEPVAITKHSKPRFVVMTVEKYNKIIAMSDPRRAYLVDEMPGQVMDELARALEDGLDDSRR